MWLEFIGISLVFLMTGTPPKTDVVRQFQVEHCRAGHEVVRYRLHRPPSERPQPLLVWLHGRGEAGDDNQSQLAWLDLVLTDRSQPFPAFILALQRPLPSPSWLPQGSTQDPIQVLDVVINDVVERFPIDRDRIYVCGISAGASGCWELARRYPGRFAAIVPLATTMVEQSHDGLTRVPVWAFQSVADGELTVRTVRELVDQIQRAGGNAHFTVIASANHDCWTAAFREYQVVDWMMAHSRGSKSAPITGSRSRGIQAYLVAFMISLICAWLRWKSRSMTRRRARSDSNAPRGSDPSRSQPPQQCIDRPPRSGGSVLGTTFSQRSTFGILPRVQRGRQFVASLSRRNRMSQNPSTDKTEAQKLTPEEARLVIKAIEDVEREEAGEEEGSGQVS